MLIREAVAEDLDDVVELRLAFLAEHRGVDSSEFTAEFRTETRDFLGRHAESRTSMTWLAADGGTTVGVVTMLLLDLAPRPEDVSGVEGYIINMYVAPSHRRRGVGKQLLGACRAAANELGLRRLVLYATPDGRPLYAGAGFRSNSNWMELLL